ncbi:MAG TPA: cytidylate kinase-like family protein [Thermoanaerobaculaceae bacterium]|nr:cytidylate kinase-like family protein [Thermoanaerobaculaceae bacterium]
MAKPAEHPPAGVFDRLADRNMRWTELRRRLVSFAAPGRPAAATVLHPYIALSRQAGAGGESLARRLGAALGWPVFDQELLDFLSEQCSLDRESLELLDETRVSWFDESVLSLVRAHFISQDEYVARLIKIVVLALMERSAVLVGRGAQAALPRERGLAVRAVADEPDRVQRIQELKRLGPRDARRWVAETDAARRDFVRRHFHVDLTDPLGYDITVNTSRLGLDGAAAVVLAAARARGLIA